MTTTQRRDLIAEYLVDVCDYAGGALRVGNAIELISVRFDLSANNAKKDLHKLIDDGRISRAWTRGKWRVWPTSATLAIAQDILLGESTSARASRLLRQSVAADRYSEYAKPEYREGT